MVVTVNERGSFWYLNGKFHRDDGPAIERPDGSKTWYKNGRLHNDAGPAYVGADESKAWYVEGKPYTEAEFNALNLTNMV